MKVVLMRHATRASQDLGDSPLSTQGLVQAERIINRLQPDGELPQPTVLYCSPKRRARETFRPLSDSTALPLVIDPRLDERHQNETGREFEQRVRSFLEHITNSQTGSRDACVFICSHLDWLELSCVLLPSDLSELEAAQPWSTAEFRIFKIEDGLWKFKQRGAVQAR